MSKEPIYGVCKIRKNISITDEAWEALKMQAKFFNLSPSEYIESIGRRKFVVRKSFKNA